MKVQIRNSDLLMRVSGTAKSIVVPESLAAIDINSLRFDGVNIVDAHIFTDFFIDSFGIKHIVQQNTGWQALTCSFDNELINDGSWRIKTTADKHEAQRKKAYATVSALAESERNKLLTQGSGKSQVYRIKETEVQAYDAVIAASGTPVDTDYPWMNARSIRRGVALSVIRNEWSTKINAWQTKGIEIEDKEEAALEQIQAVTDSNSLDNDIEAIIKNIVW